MRKQLIVVLCLSATGCSTMVGSYSVPLPHSNSSAPNAAQSYPREQNGDKSASQTVEGIFYSLPMGLIPITVEGYPIQNAKDTLTSTAKIASDRYQLTLTVGNPIVVADKQQSYFLRFNHMLTFDDQFDLSTDENGLLQSAEATSRDRSGDMAIKLADIAGTVLKAALPDNKPFFLIDGKGKPPPSATSCLLKSFAATWLFDPQSGTLKNSNVSNPTVDLMDPISEPLREGQTITLHASVADPKVFSGNNNQYAPVYANSSSDPAPGILYRRSASTTLSISVTPNDKAMKGCGLYQIVRTASVTLPASKVYVVRATRATLVQRKTELKFTNGMLTGEKLTRPSELYGAISLPADIIRSFISPGSVSSSVSN